MTSSVANCVTGAIRLALKTAQELDRGNKALSWIKDGRPAQDARQPFYEKRTACYGLVFRVIEAVDFAFNAQGVVSLDGAISQITRRKHEAYEQINDSDDEVFQNHLYDWYLTKGWADRLLEINSPFVVDYLRRSSEEDPAAADLLWRYYAHYGDYLGAAEVQFQLAKSPFDLSLEKRIEYLSRAKANASTRSTGFSESGVRNRQSRQELLRNISDHLDISNIQDDILQKIKNDSRLVGDRRAEVIKVLDGVIQPLDDVSTGLLVFLLRCFSSGRILTYDLSFTTPTPTKQATTTSASLSTTQPTTATSLTSATPGPMSLNKRTVMPSMKNKPLPGKASPSWLKGSAVAST